MSHMCHMATLASLTHAQLAYLSILTCQSRHLHCWFGEAVLSLYKTQVSTGTHIHSTLPCQVVPTGPQPAANSLSTYLSLCLGVSMSFCAALTLMLLWRWAHQTETQAPPPSGRSVPFCPCHITVRFKNSIHAWFTTVLLLMLMSRLVGSSPAAGFTSMEAAFDVQLI